VVFTQDIFIEVNTGQYDLERPRIKLHGNSTILLTISDIFFFGALENDACMFGEVLSFTAKTSLIEVFA